MPLFRGMWSAPQGIGLQVLAQPVEKTSRRSGYPGIFRGCKRIHGSLGSDASLENLDDRCRRDSIGRPEQVYPHDEGCRIIHAGDPYALGRKQTVAWRDLPDWDASSKQYPVHSDPEGYRGTEKSGH
jgi:hypothetical protein